MPGQHAVDGREAVRHLLAVLADLHGLAVEGRPVLPPFHDPAVAHHVHLVGAGAHPLDHLLRRRLAGHGGDAADVHPLEVVPLALADLEGEEADAQHRMEGELRAEILLRPRPPAALDLGMEERFEVDHHRVLAGGDQVLVVAVGGGERVEQGEEPAQPLVEARHLVARVAGRGGGELHPAILAAVEHGEGAEAAMPPRARSPRPAAPGSGASTASERGL